MLSRRKVLAGLGAAAGLGALPLVRRPLMAETGTLARPADDGFIHLRASPSLVQLLGPDRPPTPVWAYNDRVPGPELRVKQGETIRVRLHNDLPEATTIHWHGIELPNAMDGVPGLTQRAVEPGETFDYEFAPPYAGTFWYHTHLHTEEQAERGLYGPLIVEERSPIAVDRDLWFIVDDWRLLDNGCIDEASFGNRYEWAREGRFGGLFTVNGVANPVFEAARGERVRLRCVNATNARILAFDLPGLPLWLIAWDGQTLREPVRYANRNIDLGPGQRADFFIDIPADAPDRVVPRMFSSGAPMPLTTLEIKGEGRSSRTAPLRLSPPALPEPQLAGARRVDLLIEGGSQSTRLRFGREMHATRAEGLFWTFNGAFGSHHPDDTPPLVDVRPGETFLIAIANDTFYPHAIHFHGHHFRVIERDGRAVPDAPWRDVDIVGSDERVLAAFVATRPGKWLIHCHMLEHHAAGMGTWLNVRA
ncbi:MAG: multicopper oxidase family protein [Bauldia sp.]